VRCSNLGHTSTHNLFHSRSRVKITSSSRSIFKQMHPNTSPKLENTTQHISCALFTHKRREVVVTLCIRHFLAWKLPLARFAFRAVKVLASLMPRIQSAAAALLTPFRYEFHTHSALRSSLDACAEECGSIDAHSMSAARSCCNRRESFLFIEFNVLIASAHLGSFPLQRASIIISKRW